MHIYILFAHPGKTSFSRSILDAFTRGLVDAGHTYQVSDLYAMQFRSEMNESEYLRETSGNVHLPIPDDISQEQTRINQADGLAFIYPVWWSDCPAKLKGWFDRVLTCGYAYVYDQQGVRGTRMDIKKAVILCSAGHTAEHLEETGIAHSMRRVMLDDRLLGVGVREAQMVILGGMLPNDTTDRERNLQNAYEVGKGF